MTESGVKLIALTKGLFALVDEVDYERLNACRWSVSVKKSHRYFYAQRTIKKNRRNRVVLMHRVILDAPAGIMVDHVNGDTLDNRRANLRLATRSQNNANNHSGIRNMHGFRGIAFFKEGQRWGAALASKSLGRFATPEEAARAYDAAAQERYGEFATLNFPDEG